VSVAVRRQLYCLRDWEGLFSTLFVSLLVWWLFHFNCSLFLSKHGRARSSSLHHVSGWGRDSCVGWLHATVRMSPRCSNTCLFVWGFDYDQLRHVGWRGAPSQSSQDFELATTLAGHRLLSKVETSSTCMPIRPGKTIAGTFYRVQSP
jgi:hypothetical protein